jgi:hypothetical protein
MPSATRASVSADGLGPAELDAAPEPLQLLLVVVGVLIRCVNTVTVTMHYTFHAEYNTRVVTGRPGAGPVRRRCGAAPPGARRVPNWLLGHRGSGADRHGTGRTPVLCYLLEGVAEAEDRRLVVGRRNEFESDGQPVGSEPRGD